ncbi:type VII secretion-associated serine protease mycosin [Nocardia rhizosphaerae]|uniref:Type VII secretion-associated serine protease mycosin n=1 Tax=Nocardia rhizosphaerae TaxID=1691571 RepID=A0ABV8L2G0_9NOCA
MTRPPQRRALVRLTCAAALLSAVAGVPAPAAAIAPPAIDPGALEAAVVLSARPAPLEPTEQRELCAEPLLRGSPPSEPPIAQQVLDLPAAWQFSRGGGQKVAVIDTGVNRHPRLPALQAGGDYVSDTDGTVDCDGHGTLVAGIIAARPSPDDAFVGVAPDAEILSIRQLSLAYEPKDRRGGNKPPGELRSDGYGSVLTLAAAVVRAVDMGATVINISEVACTAAGSDTADSSLGAAVKYAYDRDVVVVAAAGNVETGGACETQNEGSGWGSVATIPTPAWFTPYVLSVASVDADGTPSALSLRGPWVGAAAIGRNIVSLDSKPGGTGLVDGVQTMQGVQPVDGTSFAAPYVAGLAALVRARFPELGAGQVIERITRTAHAPGRGRDDAIGAGLIDPLAALTAPLPTDPVSVGADRGYAFPAPTPPPPPDPRPRQVAIIGSLTLLTLLGVGAALGFPFRKRRADLNSEFE